MVEKARADAEKIKLIGAAEATAIENVGRSEAEAMRLKAAAYKQYGEAAILSLVFEALPKVCASPLKTNNYRHKFDPIIISHSNFVFFFFSFLFRLSSCLNNFADRGRSCRSSCQDGRDRDAQRFVQFLQRDQ